MTNTSAPDDHPGLGDPGSLFVEDQRFAVVPEWVIDAGISDGAFRLIHGRDLAGDHDDLLAVAESMHPTVAEWIADLSRVPAVLASRPASEA